MKTYKIPKTHLHHIREHLEAVNHYHRLINNYLSEIVCPMFQIDINKTKVTYDLLKGELYSEDKQQIDQNKPSESGNTK